MRIIVERPAFRNPSIIPATFLYYNTKRPLTEAEWSFLYAITKRADINILRH